MIRGHLAQGERILARRIAASRDILRSQFRLVGRVEDLIRKKAPQYTPSSWVVTSNSSPAPLFTPSIHLNVGRNPTRSFSSLAEYKNTSSVGNSTKSAFNHSFLTVDRSEDVPSATAVAKGSAPSASTLFSYPVRGYHQETTAIQSSETTTKPYENRQTRKRPSTRPWHSIKTPPGTLSSPFLGDTQPKLPPTTE